MRKDATQISVIKHNAKLIGGVIGAETEYLENKYKKVKPLDFLSKRETNIQDLTF